MKAVPAASNLRKLDGLYARRKRQALLAVQQQQQCVADAQQELYQAQRQVNILRQEVRRLDAQRDAAAPGDMADLLLQHASMKQWLKLDLAKATRSMDDARQTMTDEQAALTARLAERTQIERHVDALDSLSSIAERNRRYRDSRYEQELSDDQAGFEVSAHG